MKIKKQDIKKHLPIKQVTESGMIIAKNCDVTLCYELILPEIFNMSNAEIESQHEALNRAFATFDPGYVIAKQDWFVTETHTTEEPTGSFLSDSSKEHFTGRVYKRHYCYLFITKKASIKQARLIDSSLTKSRLVDKGTMDMRSMEKFESDCGQFSSLLQSSTRITVRRLDADQISGTEHHTGIIEKYLTLNPSGNIELVDLDFSRNSDPIIGSNHVRMYTLADVKYMPRHVGASLPYKDFSTSNTNYKVSNAAPLGMLLPYDHMYCQYIFILDSKARQKDLELSRNRMTSLAKYSRENAKGSNNIDEYLNDYLDTNSRMAKMHFNLMVWGPENSLKAMTESTAAAINSIEAKPKLESVISPILFWAGIPGVGGEIPEEECIDGFINQATCLMNQDSNYNTNDTGITLTDRLYGQPLKIDISDEPMKKGYINNRNKFIVGSSGSGKSVTVNHFLNYYANDGADIVIVDIGHSYRALCALREGYYFTYSIDNPIAFNPFVLPEGAKLPEIEKQTALTDLIFCVWGKEAQDSGNMGANNVQTRSELLTVSDSLKRYYEYLLDYPDIKPKFDTYYEYMRDVYVERLKIKDPDSSFFNLSNFLFVTESFYKGGEYDYLLNSEGRSDLFNQKFIVFEIDAIKDHQILFPIVTMIIMEVFIAKMRNKPGIRKIMLLEEAWKAIAKRGMAEYMKYLYKTCRKFFGEAWVATQDIEDILGNEFVRTAIINNADTKVIMDMQQFINNFADIKKMLGLSDHECNQVLSLNPKIEKSKMFLPRRYKETFVSFKGKYSNVWAVELSKQEYAAYTTEEFEKTTVDSIANLYGGDYQKAIDLITRTYNSDFKRAHDLEVKALQKQPLLVAIEKIASVNNDDYKLALELIRDRYHGDYKKALKNEYEVYRNIRKLEVAI